MDWDTPRRRELLEWFNRNAPSLASAYEGAVRLILDPKFPGRVHFIAHAVRDMADRLPYVLSPETRGQRVQYENALDAIESEWPVIQSPAAGGAEPAIDTIALPTQLVRRIDQLVQAHRSRTKKKSAAELLFRQLLRENPMQSPVNARIAKDYDQIRKWFMAQAHLRAETMPEVNEAELQQQSRRR